jgi:hypothetical protein
LKSILPKAAFRCAFFLWEKGVNAKDIHKKYFLFTVGSVCRVKLFTAVSRFADDEEVETEMRK